MDDPAIEFLEREKRELGDLSEELNFITNPDASEVSIDNVDDSLPNLRESHSPRVEPEKIRKWREEFKDRLAVKDKCEQEKINDLEMTANKELHDWSIRYREQLRITVKNNREDNNRLIQEQMKMNEIANKNDYRVQDTKIWESICKMCNFKPATTANNSNNNNVNPTSASSCPQVVVKEATRMRELLMSLRHQPLIR